MNTNKTSPFIHQPPQSEPSMARYLWNVMTYKLARKHAMLSWWLWIGIALFGALTSTASYLHGSQTPFYGQCLIGFFASFLSYCVLALLYDQAARKIEWAKWKAKELVSFAEKQAEEIKESAIRAREPVTALLARIQHIIQKQGKEGEEWKGDKS